MVDKFTVKDDWRNHGWIVHGRKFWGWNVLQPYQSMLLMSALRVLQPLLYWQNISDESSFLIKVVTMCFFETLELWVTWLNSIQNDDFSIQNDEFWLKMTAWEKKDFKWKSKECHHLHSNIQTSLLYVNPHFFFTNDYTQILAYKKRQKHEKKISQKNKKKLPFFYATF